MNSGSQSVFFPEYLIQFRKLLHSIPELSGNESMTAHRIADFLKSCNPDELITDVGGSGIIATWNSFSKGPEIMLRAELDALPITEENRFGHKSCHTGISHKCGHDGHMVILCGIAMLLSESKPVTGKVHLLFQPSEETGEGAALMLADKKFSGIRPDYVFALHNIPGFPIHSVILKDGNFSSSVTSIIIDLTGKTAHAAEPELGLNPASALSEIIRKVVSLENNHPDSPDMQLITPVYARMGEKAYGTSAGKATIHFTLRCRSEQQLTELKQTIESISADIAHNDQLGIEFTYTQTFISTFNHAESVRHVRNAAQKLGLVVVDINHPFKWGEDFGVFTSSFNGCMFGLGAGTDCPPLHSELYDFPDELIVTGMNIFQEVMLAVLGS